MSSPPRRRRRSMKRYQVRDQTLPPTQDRHLLAAQTWGPLETFLQMYRSRTLPPFVEVDGLLARLLATLAETPEGLSAEGKRAVGELRGLLIALRKYLTEKNRDDVVKACFETTKCIAKDIYLDDLQAEMEAAAATAAGCASAGACNSGRPSDSSFVRARPSHDSLRGSFPRFTHRPTSVISGQIESKREWIKHQWSKRKNFISRRRGSKADLGFAGEIGSNAEVLQHLRALVTLMITSAHFRSLVLDLGDVFQSCIAEIVNTGAAEQRRFRTGDLSSNSSTATSDDEGPHPQNMDSSATLKVPSPIFESAEEEYVEEEDVEDEDEVFYEAPATLEKNPHYGDLQSEVSTLVNSSANTSPNKKTKPQQKQRLQVPPLSLDTSQVIAAAAEGSGSARKESNLDSVPSTIISRRSTRSERSKRSNRSILSLTAIFKSNRTSLDDTELDTKLHDVVAEIRGHRKFREPVAGLVKFGERHVRRRKVQLEKMRSAEVDKDLRRAAENYKLLAERVTNTPWDHLLSIAARLRESPAFPSLSTAIRTTIDVDSVSSPALSPNPQSVHDSRPIVNAVRQIMDDPDGKEFAREMHRIVTGLRKDETRKEVAMWIDRLWTAVLGKGTWSSRHHHITKLHQDVRRVLIPQLFIRYQYIPIPPFTIYSNGLEIQLLDPIVISMANILPDDIHCGLRWRRDPQFAPVLGSSKGRMEIDVKVHGMQFNFDSVRVLVRPAAATEKNAKNKKKGTPTIRMPKIPWNWSGSVDGMLGGPGMSFALFYSPPTSSQPPLLQCRAIIPQRNAKFSLHGMFGPLIGPLIRKRVCLAAEREIERKVGGVLGTVLGGLAKA